MSEPAASTPTPPQPRPGLYVHVPFCRSKCGYCDFYSVTSLEKIADYAAAVVREMTLTRRLDPAADTLYFGGGTPSLLTPGQVFRLIDSATVCQGLTADSEITLEMNPATVTLEELKAFKTTGVNRLTIGVQSFKTHLLTLLGRRHSADQALQAIDLAHQAGFENVAVDLMYALPGQTFDDWRDDLRRTAALGVEHISCYMLSLEPGTPIHAQVNSGRLELPSEELCATQFRLAHAELVSAGYQHYEIANFARGTELRSRHNCKYWNFAPYLGFGPAAHSYVPPRRWWNHRCIDRYLSDIAIGKSPVGGEETLTAVQQLIETIYLGLRQSSGLSAEQLRARHAIEFETVFGPAASEFVTRGWLEQRAEHWIPTAEGMLFLDRIASDLIALVD